MDFKVDSNTASLISALIASISGMMVSVYAGVTSARNSRKLSALQANLDKHKQVTLEYLKAYLTLELDERNRSLDGFKQIIRSVQLLRDKMKRIIEHPQSYAPEVLEQELNVISSCISEAYASNQIFFSDDADRTLAHSLKNKCLDAGAVLPQFVRHRDQLKGKIDALQKEIAEDQQTLRMRARRSAELVIAETKTAIGSD